MAAYAAVHARSKGTWPGLRRLARFGFVLALLVSAPLVRADGSAGDDPESVVTGLDLGGRFTAQERPFAFVQDPSTPSRGVAALSYTFGMGSGISEERPIPVNLAAANGSHTFALSYGLTGSIAPFATGTFADTGTGGQTSVVTAGIAWQVSRPVAHSKLTISAAGMHEGQTGANGVTALLATGTEQGPLRLAANVRADKMFEAGRDALDVLVLVGASVRLTDFLRLGAEYVGQDLEELSSAEAEGGMRHTAGPTLALDLDGGRYQFTLGSGFGLNSGSPRAIVRAGASFNF